MPHTLSDHGASFGFSANVSRRMRANHGANPKGSKEGRRMNDTQTLVLIHTVAWPILIWALSKTWSSSRNAVRFSSARTMNRFPSPRCASTIQIVRPSESRTETIPQLQPALLRLSAMISQYFRPHQGVAPYESRDAPEEKNRRAPSTS